MATFSLGKLDAICARLKSTQQSQNAEVTRAQAKVTTASPKKICDNNEASAGGNDSEPLPAKYSRHSIIKECAGSVTTEKNKVHKGVVPSPNCEDKCVSTIPKNNNNNVETTDYNETASSSTTPSSCSTFQTADSTTADSLVSSTTGDIPNHDGTWDKFILNLTVQQSGSSSPERNPSSAQKNAPPLFSLSASSKLLQDNSTACDPHNSSHLESDPQNTSHIDNVLPSGCETNCPEADNSASNHDVISSSTSFPFQNVDTSANVETLKSDPPANVKTSQNPPFSGNIGKAKNEDSSEKREISINAEPFQNLEPNSTSTESVSMNGVECISQPLSEYDCKSKPSSGVSGFSSKVSPTCPSLPATGRRKSRKAAKPQRQMKDNFYFDFSDADLETSSFDKSNILCDNSELVIATSTKAVIKTPTADDLLKDDLLCPTHQSTPMTLSDIPMRHLTSENGHCLIGQSERARASKNARKKSKELSKYSSSPLDLTDSKVLVDYAQNTMNELLGIYGFGGSEAKNMLLQNFQNSPEEKSSLAVALETVNSQNRDRFESSLGPDHEVDISNTLIKKSPSSQQLASSETTNAMESASKKFVVQDSITKSLSGRKKHYTHKPINSADFNKHIKRYGTGFECGGKLCQDLGYREHYHCVDCPHKVLLRKEEMLRHYKWHKKRQDSLQHGFMRYSPTDDCSKKYGSCTHNGRQTHYHCVQNSCDKVYVSTSDVQMHANFHRKDSAIIQEGFQRFRATEDCGTTSCMFYGQRTTHFHCRRPQCHFTFKNKADMEKHKSYHQKDEILSRDGFKKFMKYEACNYANCRYSSTSNHIHCIRPGCQYVLHSSTQLYSHKRKHERRDFEFAYRNFRHLQQLTPKKMKRTGMNLPKMINPTVVENNVKSSPISGLYAVQSIPVNSSTLPIETIDTVLNLSNQKAELKVEEREDSSDFPINLAQDKTAVAVEEKIKSEVSTPDIRLHAVSSSCIKKEIDSELEPEDLSLKSRPPNFTESSFSSENTQVEGLPMSNKQTKKEVDDPSVYGYCELDDETLEDEDDDDDDDDKDYGLYEEPTLVNTDREEPIETWHPVNGTTSCPTSASLEDHMLGITAGAATLGSNISSHKIKVEHVLSSSHQSLPDPSVLLSNKRKTAIAHKHSSPEKRERDESWKKYLIRYTANDACYSRCSCLYKDHYHCRVEGCQVIFKSKDGVRSHARFHDLQDSITPLVYRHFTSGQACNETNCQYDQKEAHYHCNWTNCTHIVPDSAPTFARLEHYRIHEYAATYVGKSRSIIPGSRIDLDPLHKRRGRPPKYPKYDLPIVPKVHLTEKEITDSTIAFMHNRCPENSRIINGFKKFVVPELCPDEKCLFKGKDHYHCGRKFCHMSTDRMDVLNVHAKEFHNNITILEGYEFFERMVNCRRPVCHNNRINRHFHCVRSRCDYSFVRHSTMAQHNKKHPTVTSAVLSAPLTRSAPISSVAHTKSTPSQYVPIAPAISSPTLASPPVTLKTISNSSKNTIKSSGTYYPIPGVSKFKLTPSPSSKIASSRKTMSSNHQVIAGHPLSSGSNSILTPNGVCLTLSPIPLIAQGTPLAQQNNILAGVIPLTSPNLAPTFVNISGNTFLPTAHGQYLQPSELLTSNVLHLVQNPSAPASSSTRETVNFPNRTSSAFLQTKPEISGTWLSLKKRMYFSVQLNCGRPFCKLKKKDHYHCLDCNQAFSDPARLRTHLGKHGFRFQKSDDKTDNKVSPNALDLKISTKLDEDKGVLSESEDDPANSSLNLQPSVFASMVTATAKNEDASVAVPLNGTNFNNQSPERNSKNTSDEHLLNLSSVDDNLEESNDSILNVSSSSLTLCSSLSSPKSVSKRPFDQTTDVDAEITEPKQRKMNGSEARMGDIPGGYKRVRCGEDCGHVRCAYRQTVTHYHCTRSDCGYGFSDKLRIMQHQVRHDRLDALMGNEFQQFRASVSCERPNCEFDERASHFHCLKCMYSCADSSKVPAHRKFHAKLDKISSNGFIKYSGSADCQVATCSYFRKQTHYHCTFSGCKHAVLGPSQMAAHKLKHDQ
ncbi:uncharacterized protein LOC106072911 [Biomphalaria glabrata]|uniref:Uncharacterized protein LOC106072911 n=1 Tax=Biomphalaria glabrata TaxID=6526 RepID=A0A9U8EI96_BIOGL|nr:uncharacterized protein LOC106072911 [Biomphalaria glabrata]